MKLVYKMSASAVMAAMLLTGCSKVSTNSDTSKTPVVQTDQTAPIPQTGYRFSTAENTDIANKDKLSYRNFYSQPSKDADAEWFDAIKKAILLPLNIW